jgi:hypothetical protein
MSNFYIGLVHYPVYNKFHEQVVTSITNLDIHDISRTCKTYGVKKFYIINPLKNQKEFLDRILSFWKSEAASKYNTNRVEALNLVSYAEDIQSVEKEIKNQENDCPLIISTSAIRQKNTLSFSEFPHQKRPVLLLFGTGSGLVKEIHENADHILEPISGVDEYNHLSVRSAVAIVLDRLFSDK